MKIDTNKVRSVCSIDLIFHHHSGRSKIKLSTPQTGSWQLKMSVHSTLYVYIYIQKKLFVSSFSGHRIDLSNNRFQLLLQLYTVTNLSCIVQHLIWHLSVHAKGVLFPIYIWMQTPKVNTNIATENVWPVEYITTPVVNIIVFFPFWKVSNDLILKRILHCKWILRDSIDHANGFWTIAIKSIWNSHVYVSPFLFANT